MKKIFMIAVLILLWGGLAHAADVTASWDQPADDRVAGYRLWVGTQTEWDNDNMAVYDAGSSLSYTVTGLTIGETYIFAATSYDDSGDAEGYDEGDNESVFSDKIQYYVVDPPSVHVIPMPPPSFKLELSW